MDCRVKPGNDNGESGQSFHSAGWSGGGRRRMNVKVAAAELAVQPVKQKIDHRRRVEREHLRHQKAADNGDAERPPQFRARADGNDQRQRAQHGGKRGHQDRPESRKAGLMDGLLRRQAQPPLAVEGEVHHHDAVLLHDADQQDDADEGDHRQFRAGDLEREQGAETG